MSLISDVAASLRALPVTPRRLRSFAFVVGTALAALAWALRRHPAGRDVAGILAAALALAGALAPARLTAVYRAWMALALTLGWFASRAVLVALFALVVTPIGLVARLAGKRFLDLDLDPQAATYWVPRAGSEPNYQKMF